MNHVEYNESLDTRHTFLWHFTSKRHLFLLRPMNRKEKCKQYKKKTEGIIMRVAVSHEKIIISHIHIFQFHGAFLVVQTSSDCSLPPVEIQKNKH